MKKTKLLPVILTFVLLFTGCGTAKPASVVESAIKCLQENNLEDNDMSAMFIKSFENAQDSAAFVDKTDNLKIPCKKIDGKWKMLQEQ